MGAPKLFCKEILLYKRLFYQKMCVRFPSEPARHNSRARADSYGKKLKKNSPRA